MTSGWSMKLMMRISPGHLGQVGGVWFINFSVEVPRAPRA
jgi:hypothetical protein